MKINNLNKILVEEKNPNIYIDKSIINTTIKCQKDFLCLSNNNKIYCNVKSFMDKGMDILQCLHKEYCNYKISFGNSKFCFCPTRKEIYRKYKF